MTTILFRRPRLTDRKPKDRNSGNTSAYKKTENKQLSGKTNATIMKRCPVTRFPIRENPEWIAPHTDNGYCTVFSIIGNDIIHNVYRSETDTITLACIDSMKFQALLQQPDLSETGLFLLANLEKVTEISRRYRKDFLNFIFNWGTSIRHVVLYNINDRIRSDIERFRQIAPHKTRLTCAASYSEAMKILIKHKNSHLPTTPVIEQPSDTQDKKNDLLTAMTRISLLDTLNQPVYPPSPDHELYPCFVALETFRKDMAAKEQSFREKQKNLQKTAEDKHKTIRAMLQHEIALHTQRHNEHKTAIMALETTIRLNQKEIRRLETAGKEISAKIELLGDQFPSLHQSGATGSLFNTIHRKKTGAIVPELQIDAEDIRYLDQLKHRHPNLNHREQKICLFIKKNLSTKTIAELCGTTTRGMENIRFRLHKKLGLPKRLSIKKHLDFS